MPVQIGAGWHLHHVTDRVIELRKDSYEYRRFTGRDGYVRVRVEPQETRQHAMQRAVRMAQENDEFLSLRIAKQLPFGKAQLAEYAGKQLRLVPAFATKDQEPERIGVKGIHRG